MPLPAPLVGLTVRAKVIAANSTPAVGATVTLTPTVPARSPSGDVLIVPSSLSQTTDSNGTATWTDVLATDSPGLSNEVPYKVSTVDSTGRTLEPPYTVELLSSLAVGGVLRLDDIAPASSPSSAVTYVLAASVGAVGGPAGPLEADGTIPTDQIPAQGSVPDASTSAKGVVQLAGDLSGTATSPSVPGLANKQPLDSDLTAFAALTPTNDDIVQRKAGAWTNRSLAQLKSDLALIIADVAGLQAALDAKLAVTLADAKGDTFVATANDTVARLAVGSDGTTLVADSGQTPGVRWATRAVPTYDPSMDGLVAVAGDPALFWQQGALGTAGWAIRMPVLAGKPITGVLTCLHTAGTVGAGGTNGFAVSDDNGTLVSSTVDDNTLWATAGKRAKTLPSPIAAQPTDRYVYVSLRVTGYSVDPSFSFINGSANSQRLEGLGQGKARSFVLTGSAWGNFNPSATPNSGGYMPFLALY